MRLLLLAPLLGLVACGNAESKAPTTAAPVEPQAEPGEVTATTQAVDGFSVDIDAPLHAAAGEQVVARVQVEPRSPWHMNVDYPVRLTMLATTGVKLDAPSLKKNDAERLDDDALVFPVVFTAQAGHKGHTTLKGELHFAVCGAAECAPQRVPVEFSVEVS